ncbi:MAG: hypothetical protein JNM57_05985 [Cyclobacteriaceae bacterium]|nr:hypothetical protein [Cyclobacteriaceae bacterium]
MRQLFSISLVLLLLLNVLGYYAFFEGLHYQNKQRIMQRLDVADYNVDEALTFKIPITIPYATDSKDFERVDGEFEYNGEFFHMVKQRLYKDTLFIVCVKDNTTKQINQALTDYVKTFSDKPVDAKSSSSVMNSFIKDYVGNQNEIECKAPEASSVAKNQIASPVFTDSFYASVIHPPERA